jgi:hypothetical protein
MGLPSIEAMAFAADWIDSYEASDDDENGAYAAEVVAWLRKTIAARERDATIRATLRANGAAATSYNVMRVRSAAIRAAREAASDGA